MKNVKTGKAKRAKQTSKSRKTMLDEAKKSRRREMAALPDGGLYFIGNDDAPRLKQDARERYEAMAREIRHLMHVHNGLLKFTNATVQVICLDLERAINAKFETLNALVEFAPMKK